jgi:hypothetical protein
MRTRRMKMIFPTTLFHAVSIAPPIVRIRLRLNVFEATRSTVAISLPA